MPSSIVEEAIHLFSDSVQLVYSLRGGCVVEMRGKGPHAQVKKNFLDQLQQLTIMRMEVNFPSFISIQY